jgi:protein-S-isoprenylcysteine O-methyltransferase Ste14
MEPISGSYPCSISVSWIPAFKIGFWNAWILTLFIVLHPLILIFVDKAFGNGNINQKMGDVPKEKGEKKTIPIPTLLLSLLFIYSIFLPLKSGSAWLYAGFSIYVVGILMFLSSIMIVARTAVGHIFSLGMYRYSRHPLYLSFLFIFLGIGVVSASWLFLLLSMGWMVFPISQVTSEERGCLEAFGIDYQEYMDRTPKWLGFPKSN